MYGYSDGVAPWIFQIDKESPEPLSVLPGEPCRPIKDSRGLKDGKHQVIVTPQSSSFVLTKFVYVLFTLLHDLVFIYSLSVDTGNTVAGNGTNSTHGSNSTHIFGRAFSLDGGKQVTQVLLFVLPAYFFVALLGL